MHEEENEGLRVNYTYEIDLDELLRPKKIKVQAEPHETDDLNRAVSSAIAALNASASPIVTAAATLVSGPKNSARIPTLFEVVDDFLLAYDKKRNGEMYKKHLTTLTMLKEIVGDIPVSELRQAHLRDFFALLCKLPPRWKDACRKRGCDVRTLAETHAGATMGPKTFEDSYKASIRSFLKKSRVNYQDQSFPPHLTVEGIDYTGDREEGEGIQRAFKDKELRTLFESDAMKSFAADRALAHMFWLPHIGLYTGARVNEICQINPQVDVVRDEETGIHYFLITEETEADDRIVKSTKNNESKRRVPIHSQLIRLGFLEYIDDVRRSGAKLLFPAWEPRKNRASPEAEKWFRALIRELGLRDETPFARLVGMHAFRHTLLNRALNCRPQIDITPITGHAGSDSAVVRNYQGELNLNNLSELVESIRFDIDFVTPIARATPSQEAASH